MAASFFLNYVTSMLNLTVRAQQVGMPLQAMLQQGESLITRARNNCVANSTLSHHGYKTDQGDFATSLLQALPYRRCHMPSALRHRQARVMQFGGQRVSGTQSTPVRVDISRACGSYQLAATRHRTMTLKY